MEETRYQRIAREQRERREAREAAAKQRKRPRGGKKRAARFGRTSNREADRIDGYDRDDLGPSPDYL